MTLEAARHPRSLLPVLASLTALMILATDLYLPVLPALGADLGVGPSAAAATLSAVLVGMVIGQLVIGPLSDAHGRRVPILIGVTAFAVAQVLCAVSPSIGVLLVMRVLTGIAAAACIAVPNAVVVDTFPGDEAARGFATLAMVMSIMPVIAPLLGGALATVISWRGFFVVLAVIALAVLAVTALLLPETLPPERRRPSHLRAVADGLRSVFVVRPFLGWALAVAMQVGILFAFIGASPYVLEGAFGLTPQQFSLAFAIVALGMLTASALTRRLTRRTGASRLLIWGQGSVVLGAAILCAGVAWHLLPAVIVGLVLAVAPIGLVMPSGNSLAMQQVPGRAGAAAGALGVLGYSTGAIASPLASLGGAPWALALVISVLAVAGVVLRLALVRR